MKLNKLIVELLKIRLKHGNLPVRGEETYNEEEIVVKDKSGLTKTAYMRIWL